MPYQYLKISRLGAFASLAIVIGGAVALSLGPADDGKAFEIVSPSPSDAVGAASEPQHGTKVGLSKKNPFSAIFISGRKKAQTLDWSDLVPTEGQGQTVQLDTATVDREGAPTRKQFSDISEEDFKTALLGIGELREMQMPGSAIRLELDGRTVRIAGYVTPVGFDDTKVTEFLLVPYLGACIHVPPPPANQIIYVPKVKGIAVDDLYEPVWVTGTLRASPVATVLADVGYRLEKAIVSPYR